MVPGIHSALQTISTLKHPCLDLGSISIAPSSLSRTKGLGQLTHGSLFSIWAAAPFSTMTWVPGIHKTKDHKPPLHPLYFALDPVCV